MAGERVTKLQKRHARLLRLARARALKEVGAPSCGRYTGCASLYIAIAYQQTYLGIALSRPSMYA